MSLCWEMISGATRATMYGECGSRGFRGRSERFSLLVPLLGMRTEPLDSVKLAPASVDASSSGTSYSHLQVARSPSFTLRWQRAVVLSSAGGTFGRSARGG